MPIEHGRPLFHPDLTRLANQYPVPGRSMDALSIVPPEFSLPLKKTQEWVFDLDDTTHIHPPEVTMLRMPWFAKWALSAESVDPKRYHTAKPGTAQWTELLDEIRTFSQERYQDPDFLFKLSVNWAYAIQSDTLRDGLVSRFDFPQQTPFWLTYNEFRKAAQIKTEDEIVMADGAVNFLNRQHAMQKGIHIISNSPPESVQAYANLLVRNGFDGSYASVISTTEKGRHLRKPHPHAMRQLVKTLRLKKQDGPIHISYVGNSLEDVQFTYRAQETPYSPQEDEASDKEMEGVTIAPVLITRGMDYSNMVVPETCRFSSFSQLADYVDGA